MKQAWTNFGDVEYIRATSISSIAIGLALGFYIISKIWILENQLHVQNSFSLRVTRMHWLPGTNVYSSQRMGPSRKPFVAFEFVPIFCVDLFEKGLCL